MTCCASEHRGSQSVDGRVLFFLWFSPLALGRDVPTVVLLGVFGWRIAGRHPIYIDSVLMFREENSE